MQPLRLLYLQVRHEDLKEHELKCIERSTGISRENITTVNVFDRLPEVRDLVGHHGVIIGGSGDYCVSQGDIKDEVAACSRVLYEACEKSVPVMAICFGAHVLTQTLGGKVKQDLAHKETGTFDIELLPDAKNDILFRDLPSPLRVQQGHKDGFEILPQRAIPLARSEWWPYQAYVIKDTPIYAIQFHPELDIEDVVYRLNSYQSLYVFEGEDMSELIGSLRPTPVASTIPKMFVDRCMRVYAQAYTNTMRVVV